MTVEMISRRLALFISSIALLGTLAFSVPAARFFTSSPPEKKTLRVMTYNIHVGVGMDKKLDLQRIAEVINAEHPDLVGLQEVDRGVKRTEGKDEIAELAKLTAMNYAFAHNLDYQGGHTALPFYRAFLLSKLITANTRTGEKRNDAA